MKKKTKEQLEKELAEIIQQEKEEEEKKRKKEETPEELPKLNLIQRITIKPKLKKIVEAGKNFTTQAKQIQNNNEQRKKIIESLLTLTDALEMTTEENEPVTQEYLEKLTTQDLIETLEETLEKLEKIA